MFAIDRIRKATVKILKSEFLTFKFNATEMKAITVRKT